MFKHVYFDGCNGDQMGATYGFDEAVQFLISKYPKFWTKESAIEALKEAQEDNEELRCEDEGMDRLIPV